MSRVDDAVALFDRFNCAQSVFAACGAANGLDEKSCLIVSGAFGGGMARMGETCGAVTGALMALGVRYGEAMATDPDQARGPLYDRVSTFVDAFKARHGSITCRELTGCDLRTPEGRAQFSARDLHHSLCRNLVASAVELVENEKE